MVTWGRWSPLSFSQRSIKPSIKIQLKKTLQQH